MCYQDFSYQQYNVPVLKLKIVINLSKEKDWKVYRNAIENVWAILKQKLHYENRQFFRRRSLPSLLDRSIIPELRAAVS